MVLRHGRLSDYTLMRLFKQTDMNVCFLFCSNESGFVSFPALNPYFGMSLKTLNWRNIVIIVVITSHIGFLRLPLFSPFFILWFVANQKGHFG